MNEESVQKITKPIGVFWDIENVQVPRNVRAIDVVQTIRTKFFSNHKEVEFICVCDVLKEKRCVTRELNLAQVNVIHIDAIGKNAADDKICQLLSRFTDWYPPPATIILISSDIKFAADLSDLRHRKGYHIILLHNVHVNTALLHSVNEHYLFTDLVPQEIKQKPDVKQGSENHLANTAAADPDEQCTELMISGYDPAKVSRKKVKRLLRDMVGCLGGKNIFVDKDRAYVNFQCSRDLARARKRMEGEHLSGHRIHVDYSHRSAPSIPPTCTPGETTAVPSGARSWTGDKPSGAYPGSGSRGHKPLEGQGERESPHPNVHCVAPIRGQRDAAKYSPKPSEHALLTDVKPFPRPQSPCAPGPRTLFPGREEPVSKSAEASGLQTVVDKFARERKPSRQVLMLQQQLYQEGQEHQRPKSTPPTVPTGAGHSAFKKGQGYYSLYSQFSHEECEENANFKQFLHYRNPANCHSSGYHSEPSLHNASFDSSTYNHFPRHGYDVDPDYYPAAGSFDVNQGYGRAPRYNQGFYDYSYSYPRPWRGYSPHYGHHSRGHHYQHQQQGPYYGRDSSYRNQGTSRYPVSNHNNNSFRPIRSASPSTLSSMSCDLEQDWDSMENGPVELMVSNLDYNISAKEWRKILFITFHPHVKVLNVHVKSQPDNTSLGMVKVASKEEARFAISQFHRRKIGYKRIHVTLKMDENCRPVTATRAEAMSLLLEAKDNMLPLFKFIELFDKRYHRSISVSDLYRMRDVIEIREQGGAGRMVYLATANQGQATPPSDSEADLCDIEDILEQPVCLVHCPEGSASYAEAVNSYMLPNVKMSMKSLAPNVHSLLQTHNGSMPLMSFPACFVAEFSALPIALVSQGGVPLEHLISCVPGVQIQVSPSGVKKVQWAENLPPVDNADSPRSESSFCSSIGSNPLLSQQLNQISREMVDLLRQSPNCRMPISKFIPSYHHFFGRQCRVADYGYNRLKDLFEAIPHVVQVLGTGDRKVLTLSHKAQMKRFTNDLLKILKIQPGKQLYVTELPQIFVQVFGNSWDVTQYGMSHLEDLLAEVSSSVAMVIGEGDQSVVVIPRKDQTPEEVERTKQFALEVVDLLKHNPQCRMPFNKFIPAYHHHFGRQCRVSNYGFTKLLDLFEAIPHVVEIEEEGEERLIHLTEPELRKILAEQIVNLLKQQPNRMLPLHHLMSSFTCHFGFNIPLLDFNVDSEEDLVNKLKHVVKIEIINRCKYIVLQNKTEPPKLAFQVLQLLMDQSGGSLPLEELVSRYNSIYSTDCDTRKIKEELLDYVQVIGEEESAVISLTPLQVFARDVRLLLVEHQQILLSQFDNFYRDKFGVELKPALFGFQSTLGLLKAIPHVVEVKKRGLTKYCELSPAMGAPSSPTAQRGGKVYSLEDRPSSASMSCDSGVMDPNPEEDMLGAEILRPKAMDLLAGHIPSLIPSPELKPEDNAAAMNLIHFESNPDFFEKIWTLSDEEKKVQKTPLCLTPTSELLNFAAQCLISQGSSASAHPGSVDLASALHALDQGAHMSQSHTDTKPKKYTILTKPATTAEAQERIISVEKVPKKNPTEYASASKAKSQGLGTWWNAQDEATEKPSLGHDVKIERERQEEQNEKLEGQRGHQRLIEEQERESCVEISKAATAKDGELEKENQENSSKELKPCDEDITDIEGEIEENIPKETIDDEEEENVQVLEPKKTNKKGITVETNDKVFDSGLIEELPKHRIHLPKLETSQNLDALMHPSSVSYDNFCRLDTPLDTSSARSDSSSSAPSDMGSPHKSPRKKRLAAKFSVPVEARDC